MTVMGLERRFTEWELYDLVCRVSCTVLSHCARVVRLSCCVSVLGHFPKCQASMPASRSFAICSAFRVRTTRRAHSLLLAISRRVSYCTTPCVLAAPRRAFIAAALSFHSFLRESEREVVLRWLKAKTFHEPGWKQCNSSRRRTHTGCLVGCMVTYA